MKNSDKKMVCIPEDDFNRILDLLDDGLSIFGKNPETGRRPNSYAFVLGYSWQTINLTAQSLKHYQDQL